jgi:hypothetical protein
MAGHGSAPLRGLESAAQSSINTGKFGRLFRWLPPSFQTSNSNEDQDVEKLLKELARRMVSTEFNDRIDAEGKETPDVDLNTFEEEDENRAIPAGYTYLGQFIDHDITFDPASSLQQQNDPDALEDFRTPRLDLDSLYGRGPDDEPHLYERPARVKFRLGPDRGVSGQHRPDLLRSDDNTALIGDKRNDENKIVSQIHTLFLKFHNKAFEDISKRFPSNGNMHTRFLETQRIVRWCYQWIVLDDYLPLICGKDVVNAIMPGKNERRPNLKFYEAKSGEAFMPVEFSVAAFRFGHSMVRPSYSLNDVAKSSGKFTSKSGRAVDFARIPIFVAQSKLPTDAMNGFGEPLPQQWGIDWSFFFGTMPQAKDGVKQVPQPSYRIDATLVDPLGELPEFVSTVGLDSPFISLAFRNLMRSFRMGLPSGQAVARMMGIEEKKMLTDDELWSSKGKGDENEEWPEGKTFFDANKRWLEGHAPLWFYILKEAELHEKGHRLGKVGSRIVAETLIGLAWFDHYSYLFQASGWNPSMEGIEGLDEKLDMLKLTKYVG